MHSKGYASAGLLLLEANRGEIPFCCENGIKSSLTLCQKGGPQDGEMTPWPTVLAALAEDSRLYSIVLSAHMAALNSL